MAGEASSIKKLKSFYGDRLYVPSEDDMISEMVSANDRSCIITIGSLTDTALESKIASNLPGLNDASEKEVNYAFRFDGPLGSFSARIELAFYMGLIEASVRDQLHDLRALRNAVAHTKRRVSFSDAALQNVAKRLFSPIGLFKLLDSSPEGFKRTLIAEGNAIYNIITFGRDEAITRMRAAFEEDGRKAPF